MIDFNYIWVDIECPKCNYQNEVQLIDAKSEKSIFCNNCKSIIQLQDSEASVHTGVESINNALKDLDDLFKNFGK
jgi:transcription elongation factor Elf1